MAARDASRVTREARRQTMSQLMQHDELVEVRRMHVQRVGSREEVPIRSRVGPGPLRIYPSIDDHSDAGRVAENVSPPGGAADAADQCAGLLHVAQGRAWIDRVLGGVHP